MFSLEEVIQKVKDIEELFFGGGADALKELFEKVQEILRDLADLKAELEQLKSIVLESKTDSTPVDQVTPEVD